MSSEFVTSVFNDIDKYNMVNVFSSSLNKTTLYNTVYYFAVLIYLAKYHTYNSVFHWVILILTALCAVVNGLDKHKNWPQIATIILTILIVITYIFPYTSTNEILIHPFLLGGVAVMSSVYLLFITGVFMALTPSTHSIGKLITTHLYF